MFPELEQLIPIVKSIAQAELLPRFQSVRCHYKEDGSAVTEADITCNNALKSALATQWPGIPFLSEELPDNHSSDLGHYQNLWVVDPLDGTNNFVYGIPYFCLSLALVDSEGPVLAVVYDPIRDECFSASRGNGSQINGEPLCPPVPGPPPGRGILLANTNRLPTRIREALYNHPCFSTVRSFGASALDWCWMAAGRGHLCLHAGQNFWDYAAGLLILTEAGGYARTFEQESVFRLSTRTRSVIAAIDQEHFERLNKLCR